MRIFARIIGVILLLIFFGTGSSCLAAKGVGLTLDNAKLLGLYKKFISADIPFPESDIKILNFSCRPKGLVLSSGKVEYQPFMGAMSGRLGRRVIDLNILVNGLKAESIKMAADIQLYGNVITAVRTLKRNNIITRQDVTVSRRDISMLGSDLVIDLEMLLGKQLKKTVRPGAVLFKSFIKPPQIIKRGDMVYIVVDKGGLHISVQGQARSAGALGETIKVKNMMSRREVYGLISSDKEVTVMF